MDKSGFCSRNEMEGFDQLLNDDFLDEKYVEQFMKLIRDDDEQIIESSAAPATYYHNTHFSGDMGSGDTKNGGEYFGTKRNDIAKKRNCKKMDKSRTLDSERRRRGRMKDSLYALRSLVPNITKMDKASIIADAVLYIQELQQKTNNLQKEIACIESSISQADNEAGSSYPVEVFLKPHGIKQILQMDVTEVEERGYYGKIVCKKGQGIAAFLYKSLESLELCLQVHSSHIATVDQNYVLTFILNVRQVENTNLSTLKVWIASAFLGQGFYF